jgi:GT2 family glycosyltransferase
MLRTVAAVAKVSVYVPAYNVGGFLTRAIEALLAQTHAPDEILVIDDGSRDSTAEIAGRYPQVTLVRHTENRGLAAARNTGFQMARNGLVASIDADCVPAPNWLASLLPHMENSNLAGVGGRLVEGMLDSVADRWRSAHMPQEWGPEPIHNPMFLFGANNIFRKSAVLDAGGYDESMRTNGEDADLCRRLRAKNWDLAYDPVARVTHMRHDTVRSILDAYWRWMFFGRPDAAEGIKLHLILRHAFLGNVRHMLYGLVKADWKARRFELIGLDFLTVFYFPYREIKTWLNSRKPPKLQADSRAR